MVCANRRPPAPAPVPAAAAGAGVLKLAIAESKVLDRTSADVSENKPPPVTALTPTGRVERYSAWTACREHKDPEVQTIRHLMQ